ncbi:MAG: hypothetical protein AVDCRST_MAG04-4039, partial [uncultured Acetobacteraceae bacterium]
VRRHVAHRHRRPARPARVLALRGRGGGAGRPRAGAALGGAGAVFRARRHRVGLAGAAPGVLGRAARTAAAGV